MSFKSKMDEATRLTREGRLAEAAALIQRSLGAGAAPAGPSARVVETPAIEVTSKVISQPSGPEPPAAGAETGGPPPIQPESGGSGTPPRMPAPPPLPPRFPKSFTGAQISGLLKSLPGRGRAGQRFPAEVVAPAAGQWVSGSHIQEAGQRGYKLYLPSHYRGQSLPLVVMLHGCTQSADDFAAGTRLNFLAEAEGLLVVYPEQVGAANSSRCWNWFQPGHQQRARGEPAIIAGITLQVMAEHHVNPERVYIAGLSAGGAMAAILAVTYPELYAAVGVHSGLAPGSARDLPSALQAMQRGGSPGGGTTAPGRTLPLILFHGDKDSTVHPGNAEELTRQWTGPATAGSETLRLGQVAGGRSYTCAVYQDPSGRTLVERWTIHGGSHSWSGGSPHGTYTDPTGPDASGEMLRFFRNHPKTTTVY